MAETLKEFLISLGWDAEKAKHDQRHFEEAIEYATVRAELLADFLKEAARKIGEIVQETSNKLRALHFEAQRLNTTAALANDFPLLIKKYGGNPAEAATLLETAAHKLRENKNRITILNQLGFGIDATTGKLEVQEEMLGNLHNLTEQQVVTLATILGLPDQPLLLMKRHLDEVLPDLKEFDEFRTSLGFDIEGAARDGAKFQSAWIEVKDKLENIVNMIGAGLEKSFTPFMEQFNEFLTTHAHEIGAVITEVSNAIAKMFEGWGDSLGAMVDSPNTTKAFADDIRSLAESIAWLARKMESLVGWLKEIAALPDVLNYLSGNTKDMESYNRGKALLNDPSTSYGSINRALNPTIEDVPEQQPEWGPSKRLREKIKKWWSGDGGDAAPAAPKTGAAAPAAPKSGAAPAGAAGGQGTVVFGDSIGAGLAGEIGADRSNAMQGMNPDWVAKKILAYQGSLAGKDVVISSGASNDTRNALTVRTQIQNALDKGADPKRITVLGVGSLQSAVGNYPGASEAINKTLQSAAKDAGVKFQALPAGTDVHPDYRQLAKSLPPPAAAPAAPPARATPPPSGGLTPFKPSLDMPKAPPFGGLSLTPPGPLGGSVGDSHINAPAHVSIRVDGTGDPTAVAHLVKGAQKSVDAEHWKNIKDSNTPYSP